MRDNAFRVIVAGEDGIWTATVQGVPQATIHSRRLSALDMQVRARLADLFDRPAGSFVLYYRLHGHGGAHG